MMVGKEVGMSARNIHHDQVVRALRADGWTITHDPYTLAYGGRDMFIDLGAEKQLIGATRGTDLIAVEIQSFLQRSPVRALQEAVGQYLMYKAVLETVEPSRRLIMAVPLRAADDILAERLGQLVLRQCGIKALVYDHETERVVRWIE
jgi:hypothetical protein